MRRELNDLEIRWLEIAGGRTEEDVGFDKHGPYVFMGNGKGGLEKIYIPGPHDLYRMQAFRSWRPKRILPPEPVPEFRPRYMTRKTWAAWSMHHKSLDK